MYPFDLVYQKIYKKFMMKKIEKKEKNLEKIKGIFKIVKGLSGSGVSFMVKREGEEYNMVNKIGIEEVTEE